MKMTKEERYRITIRSFAKQCLGTNSIITQYVIDDITSRTEKTFLNRYIRTLTGDIADLKYFDMLDRVPLLEKTLEICYARLARLAQ